MAPPNLHGRAFYESIGSPKYILAPMVNQSEFAWRLLTRSFLPPDLRTSILAYSPMMPAKMFASQPKYRSNYFKPLKSSSTLPQPADEAFQEAQAEEGEAHLDGNPTMDRPLFMQFCANEPDQLLEAAKLVQPHCDAVDLNLGCPQGIARRGHYGAFLQEDWDTIRKLINTLHNGLDIPVTAKMRILETRERTLEYAKMILDAGASIITVHGRQRDQKGHNTGLADWSVIRFLREQLPPETVIFANGNILQHADLEACLQATKADGVMSAEGNLYDPTIFATEPSQSDEVAAGGVGRLYWRGRGGKGGYRMDAVLRRYLDIIYRHVLDQEPPVREPLFLPWDTAVMGPVTASETNGMSVEGDGPPPAKKQRRAEAKKQAQNSGKQERCSDINLVAIKAHCFHMLRQLVSKHTTVRDALARTHTGDMEAFEHVLQLTEAAVKEGLLKYEADSSAFEDTIKAVSGDRAGLVDDALSSDDAVRRCKRPYWVCQPYIRPLPKEALEKGSLQLSKKELAKLNMQAEINRDAGLPAGGSTENVDAARDMLLEEQKVEIPREGLVCG